MPDRFRPRPESTFEIPVSPLSIGGLSRYLQDLLQEDPLLAQVWLTGEISSCSRHRNGHWFLTLTDPDSGEALEAVIWRSQSGQLPMDPEAGLQVYVLGQVKLYPERSRYQLQIMQMLPVGEGLMALRLQQLKLRLQAEGFFEASRKRPLPNHPAWVGVVTSPQAAAWGDIQRTLTHRYPGLRVILAPAIVQGGSAPASIAGALQKLALDGRAEVVIVARGGGASEDLSCFNDERVVRAIADCPIPVITGIGHQRDETLADWVADACAHTPTAAAERAVPRIEDLQAHHRDLALRLSHRIQSRIQSERETGQTLSRQLLRLNLDDRLASHSRQLALRQASLQHITDQLLQRQSALLQAYQDRLAALDPQAVLRRGYAIVFSAQGEQVRSTQLPAGTPLTLRLASGTLQVRVEDPK